MKKSSKIFLSLLLFLVVTLLTIVGFIFADKTESTTNVISEREYIVNSSEEYIKPLGRSYYNGYKRYFSFSGSGIEFSFKGEYAELNLLCEDAEELPSNRFPRYAVYLNGVKIEEDVIDTNVKTVRINTFTSEEESVVTLIKQSEAKLSSFSLASIKTYSRKPPAPTEDKNFSIEFIGDSLTCGYGIDEIDPNGVFSTDTESFTGTYAYQTALNLNADFSAVCFSGYGVVTGYSKNGKKYPDSVVSKYYSSSAFLSGDIEPNWDFSKKDTDLVILNLGTNDAIYCQGGSSRQNEFVDSYISFIKTIRIANPKAYILCVLGDTNNSVFPLIERAASEYSASSLDFSIGTSIIEFDMGNNDIVVDGHPGPLSNVSAANSLTQTIRELISQGKVEYNND